MFHHALAVQRSLFVFNEDNFADDDEDLKKAAQKLMS